MNIQELINKEFLTTKQSAKSVGIETETMRQYLSNGRYPYEAIRVTATDIHRFTPDISLT